MTNVARLFLAAALTMSWLISPAAHAESTAGFYKDKTISVVIGTGHGGSYGAYALLVARHLGRFVPGNPSVIVQSMPGAGGLVALNYLGQKAPRDGTTISVIHATLLQEGLFNPKAKFNPADFRWIGRLARITFLGVASRKSGIASLDGARKRQVIVGAPGRNNVPAQLPLLFNKISGTNFKVITGYKSMGEVLIALTRGEIDCAVPTEATLAVFDRDIVKKGGMVPIFALADTRLKNYPNVPILLEFGRNETERAFLGIFALAAEIGRSLAAPPGVPAERLTALRAAFDRTVADPRFNADLTKIGVELSPKTGQEMQQMVQAVLSMPNATRTQAKAFYDDLLKQ